MIRHISQPPSDSSGDQNQDEQEQQDDKEQEQQEQDKEQDQDKQQEQEQNKNQGEQGEQTPSALEQLLQDMDQNPRNLEADEAAKKARGTIVLPLRDW